MKCFKFFQGNEEDQINDNFDSTTSWMYGRLENLTQYNHDVVIDRYYGIHSFLNTFPPGYIAIVISITGPNGLVHTADNEGIGWGFDILTEPIMVEWIRFHDTMR